jgi:hypothetical protein
MVRRLKSDLRRLGEAFPERKVETISIAGLPDNAPELDLRRRGAVADNVSTGPAVAPSRGLSPR